MIISSIRTASAGGRSPAWMKRRTLAYDARSTSMEKVESGDSRTRRKPFSSIRAYDSVLWPGYAPTTEVAARPRAARSTAYGSMTCGVSPATPVTVRSCSRHAVRSTVKSSVTVSPAVTAIVLLASL